MLGRREISASRSAERSGHGQRPTDARARRLAGASAYSARPPRKRGRPAQPRFLPVSVASVAPPAAVEIHLPSGIVLRIGRDCDLAALRAVLGAVLDGQMEAAAC